MKIISRKTKKMFDLYMCLHRPHGQFKSIGHRGFDFPDLCTCSMLLTSPLMIKDTFRYMEQSTTKLNVKLFCVCVCVCVCVWERERERKRGQYFILPCPISMLLFRLPLYDMPILIHWTKLIQSFFSNYSYPYIYIYENTLQSRGLR